MASPSTIASIDHYTELSIYPRWPGLEEDDDLAGPADSAPSAPVGAGVERESFNAGGKTWTRKSSKSFRRKSSDG